MRVAVVRKRIRQVPRKRMYRLDRFYRLARQWNDMLETLVILPRQQELHGRWRNTPERLVSVQILKFGPFAMSLHSRSNACQRNQTTGKLCNGADAFGFDIRNALPHFAEIDQCWLMALLGLWFQQ